MSRHDWEAIERALIVERMTVPEVVEKFSVPRTTVYNRARKRGWDYAPAERVVGVRATPGGDGLPDVGALLSRLKQAALKHLGILELDTETEEEAPERHARAMDAMLKAVGRIEKLEMARAMRPRPSWEWTPEQREAVREALAQQIFKMIEQIRGEPLPD